MTHRISGDRADAQICEETGTMVKATDGTALKRLEQRIYTSHVWMSQPDANSLDIGVSSPEDSIQNIKQDLMLQV